MGAYIKRKVGASLVSFVVLISQVEDSVCELLLIIMIFKVVLLIVCLCPAVLCESVGTGHIKAATDNLTYIGLVVKAHMAPVTLSASSTTTLSSSSGPASLSADDQSSPSTTPSNATIPTLSASTSTSSPEALDTPVIEPSDADERGEFEVMAKEDVKKKGDLAMASNKTSPSALPNASAAGSSNPVARVSAFTVLLSLICAAIFIVS